MKKMFLMTFVMIMAMNGCKAGEQSESLTSDEVVTEVRKVDSFNGVKLVGSCDVIYRQGAQQKVEVVAPREVADRLATEVSDGVLTISVKKGSGTKIAGVTVVKGISNAKIYVTSPQLKALSLVGSGDITAKGDLKAKELTVSLQGSGDIVTEGNVNAEDVVVNLLGSGDITVKSLECTTLDARLQGSGDLSIGKADVKTAYANLHGSGDLRLHLSSCTNLTGRLQGSGDLKLSGKTYMYSRSKTGTGDIHDSGLKYDVTAASSDVKKTKARTVPYSPGNIEAQP